MTDSLIVIPARLAATRLPDKPMAEIAGEPMIVHVWRRAMEANCGPVVVATDAEAVRDAVATAGGEALMTLTVDGQVTPELLAEAAGSIGASASSSVDLSAE